MVRKQPRPEGYARLVGTLLIAVCGSNVAAQEIKQGAKQLPMEGEAFKLDGHDAFVISPKALGTKSSDTQTPWVWYAPTLKRLPGKEELWMIKQFLASGIAIAGIDVGESYGSPTGNAGYDKLYEYLTEQRDFSASPVLLARSRGGLMLYSWAAENSSRVAGIAGIYPVCNLESYPGLANAASAYKMSAEELKTNLEKYNPIDRLETLAEAKVRVFHIHGDSDKIVPIEANSAIVAQRYAELGGKMELEIVNGQGHNMWNGWFQSQRLTDFVIKCATSR